MQAPPGVLPFVEVADSFDDYVPRRHIDRELIIEQLEDDLSALSHVEATEQLLDVGMPDWRDDAEIVGAFEAARRWLAGQ